MLNPMMISFFVKQKLDEILAGTVPEGFKEKERTENRIVIAPDGGAELVDGVKISSLTATISYNNKEIVFVNE